MEPLRSPLQGVGNIVRFNWPFYAGAALATVSLFVAGLTWLPGNWGLYAVIGAGVVAGATLLSLLASAYVYDWSDLYTLPFTKQDRQGAAGHAGAMNVVNINAGFDETSGLIQQRYPGATLTVLDFYDPLQHTEASIGRARAAYPPYPGTLTIATDRLPLADGSVDRLFLTLAAHEIRDAAERTVFFRECRRVLAPGGIVYLTEHLRDAVNFAVYNFGFLHFHGRRAWLLTIRASGLCILREHTTTPFVTTFILTADAAATV